jgi:hypothetical protein
MLFMQHKLRQSTAVSERAIASQQVLGQVPTKHERRSDYCEKRTWHTFCLKNGASPNSAEVIVRVVPYVAGTTTVHASKQVVVSEMLRSSHVFVEEENV